VECVQANLGAPVLPTVMPKPIIYPLALLEFFPQYLTLPCASASRHTPQVFYVYGTSIFLIIILVLPKVIHGTDTESWILYNPLLNLCVQHDFVHEYIIAGVKNIKYNQV
jgi:hypothetical protein